MLDGHRQLEVRSHLDVFVLRRAARELATGCGFAVRARQALEIVVSELATNILKHGVRGDVRFQSFAHATHGPGVRIEARDRGPAILDLGRALEDGSDARGPLDPAAYYGRRGIGSGLGAILRLSDELHYAHEGEGNCFLVVVYRDLAERRRLGSRATLHTR